MSASSMDHDQTFSGPQVCAIVGVTYRQLDYWARTELLTPSVAEAKGSGSKRRYSYHDVVSSQDPSPHRPNPQQQHGNTRI